MSYRSGHHSDHHHPHDHGRTPPRRPASYAAKAAAIDGDGYTIVHAGKQVRLGPGGSALLATGTMGTSAGVASSALDSYTPIGGLTALGPIALTIIPVLALAGSLARARVQARSLANLSTSGPVIITFHLTVVVMLGGLGYLPMLALGLIAEPLLL